MSIARSPARIALAALALFCATTGQALASHCVDANAAAIRSVVRVNAGAGADASGVVIAPGLVLTAAHAVTDEDAMRVAADGEARRRARVIAMDHYNDLALLATDTAGIPAIALAARDLGRREAVWAAGFPQAGEMHVSEGNYARPRGDRIEAHAWIDSGHSGGALLHCDAGEFRLAGIIHGFVARRANGGYENTGRSVSVSAPVVSAFVAGASHLASLN